MKEKKLHIHLNKWHVLGIVTGAKCIFNICRKDVENAVADGLIAAVDFGVGALQSYNDKKEEEKKQEEYNSILNSGDFKEV